MAIQQDALACHGVHVRGGDVRVAQGNVVPAEATARCMCGLEMGGDVSRR